MRFGGGGWGQIRIMAFINYGNRICMWVERKAMGRGGRNEYLVLCKEFIIMFALHDHLPLDRIITRFSSPTTITQFQRSSSDGILIELARMVPHGANDNIFCRSGPAESAGGEGRQAPPPQRTREFCIVQYTSGSFLFYNNARRRIGPVQPIRTSIYCKTRGRTLVRVPELWRLKRDVWLGGGVNAWVPTPLGSRPPTSTLVWHKDD